MVEVGEGGGLRGGSCEDDEVGGGEDGEEAKAGW